MTEREKKILFIFESLAGKSLMMIARVIFDLDMKTEAFGYKYIRWDLGPYSEEFYKDVSNLVKKKNVKRRN